MVRHLAQWAVAATMVIAANAAGAEPALVGSLDCRLTEEPENAHAMDNLPPERDVRCLFLERRMQAQTRPFVGKLTQSAPGLAPDAWIAWGVYSRNPDEFEISDLRGVYRVIDPASIGQGLAGGADNAIQLRPIKPTPGEGPATNHADGATALSLQRAPPGK